MELARWRKFSLTEQMSHIGSEFLRAEHYMKKGDFDNGRKFFENAIDLIDLTISDPQNKNRLYEILRLKEVLCDLFIGSKKYNVSYDFLKNYFLFFALNLKSKI